MITKWVYGRERDLHNYSCIPLHKTKACASKSTSFWQIKDVEDTDVCTFHICGLSEGTESELATTRLPKLRPLYSFSESNAVRSTCF